MQIKEIECCFECDWCGTEY